MSFTVGVWGDDPSSDLAHLVQKLTETQGREPVNHEHLVPPLRLGQKHYLDLGARVRQFRDAPIDHDLPTVLLKLLPELRRQPRLKKETLVLQIDSFDSLIDNGQFAPPPLNYYRYIIMTRYWKRVLIVNFGNDDNPLSTLLKREFRKINIAKGSLLEKWQIIAHARHLVLGASQLAHLLAQTNLTQKRYWLPQYTAPNMASSRHVLPIDISDYIAPFAWQGSGKQIDQLIRQPADSIGDHNRWLFTETERCRSFEYCQSCRDTGAAGKLWRRVIANRFDVPSPDWECPHGWKWGGKPSALLAVQRKLKLGSAIKKTTTALGVVPCKDCVERGHRWDGTHK